MAAPPARRLTLAALALAALLGAATASAPAEFQILKGHGGPIMDTAISPDGTQALTASFDNSVGLWTLADGSVRWLEGHEAAVKTALFLGDDRAASAGDDFAIEIWNLAAGTRQYRLTGHRGQVAGLAVSADGTTLASASWDGTIGLWDLTTGAPLALLKGHRGAVNDVTFSGDGALLYSASADGTIRIWDVADRAQNQILVRHGFGVTKLLLAEPKGWLAYGAVDGGTRVMSLADDAVLADLTLDRRPILAMAAPPDFSRLAVGDGEGYIMIVETDRWSIQHDFHATKTGPIWALAYSRDGQNLLAGGIDDAAYFWPVDSGEDSLEIASEDRSFLRPPESMSNGERQFRRKCSICHTLTPDSARRAGPTLFGLFGRASGSVAGYIYSSAVAKAGLVWNDDTIDTLFELGPDVFVPGTKMPTQRINKPADRQDLIEFLKENTSG